MTQVVSLELSGEMVEFLNRKLDQGYYGEAKDLPQIILGIIEDYRQDDENERRYYDALMDDE